MQEYLGTDPNDLRYAAMMVTLLQPASPPCAYRAETSRWPVRHKRAGSETLSTRAGLRVTGETRLCDGPSVAKFATR